jgi:23S rRNA pseudouridine1911/1915/1917 synthase
LRRELQSFPRQALHAKALEFVHPGSGEDVRYESPLPEDFERLLGVLRRDLEAHPG